MSKPRYARPTRLGSARLWLAISYAVFLVVAGAIMLLAVYVVLRYVPSYPILPPDPRDLGRPGVVVGSRQEILRTIVQLSGFILAALTVIGISGGWLLAGRILRPLQQLDAAARIAASGRLDHRIRLAGHNDEFGRLADTFDDMLDRLQDAFEAQERFAANASHELRTPLAVTATMLDVARANPEGQDYPQLLERLSITNARAIGLTEALLRLADANAVTSVREPCDLADIVGDVVAEQEDDARQRQLTLHIHLAPTPVDADATLLRQAAVNLIQNAILHNHPAGEVWITTQHDRQRASATLHVENTGALYTPGEAARLTEPFLRGAGRVTRSSQHQGYGLGLAIVARIVAVHDGALTVVPRSGGGLAVTVTLAADTPAARRTILPARRASATSN